MLKLTEEQQAVVNGSEPFLAVNAFAGAGKTATLRAYALARPKTRFLYIAFNRALREEAQRKMPRHVVCHTAHSLAFEALFRQQGWPIAKLWRGAGSPIAAYAEALTASPLADALADPRRTAAALSRDLVAFCASHHNDWEAFYRERLTRPIADAHDAAEFDLVLTAARYLWSRLADPNDPLPLTHDAYFKLWQLQRPDLSYRFDAVLLDEGQDVSAAMYALFLAQERLGRMIVGDRHQWIYGWRHAINAMAKAQEHGATVRYLTHSWRFGPNIAALASALLRHFKQETRAVTASAQQADAIRDTSQRPTAAAILARTNAGVLEAAIERVLAGESVRFLADKSRLWREVLAAHRLHRGLPPQEDRYAGFASFAEAKAWAEMTEDRELMMQLHLAERYGEELPQLLAEVQRHEHAQAPWILATAHTAKGQEWDEVWLAEDFPELVAGDGGLAALEESEANLWYVAVTRARRRLWANGALERFLIWLQLQKSAPSSTAKVPEIHCAGRGL